MKTSLTFLLLLITWMILNESYSYTTILYGIVISFITLLISESIFKKEVSSENISIKLLIKYFVMTILDIYKAGIILIPGIISGVNKPEIVKVKTHLKGDIKISMLCNAITLTPGTITVEKKGQEITILWLNPTTKDKRKMREILIGNIEDRLRS